MFEKNTNLIIGKRNSGKTRGILFKEVDSLINNNENLLILDNKEEYYKTFGKKLFDKGYNVYVLNLKNAEKSNGFNPLSLPYFYYKQGKTDKVIKIINDLGHILFKENNCSDPFWENSAADYFSGLVLTLFKEGAEEEINLGSIGTMMAKLDVKIDNTTIFQKYLNTLDPLNAIYISSSSSEFAPYDTRASIISVMRQKLNMILMKEILLNTINTNELKLNEFQEKTAIFIIGDQQLNIANILINQVYNMLEDVKMKFNFILDNFDLLPVFDNLKEMIYNAKYLNLKLDIAINDINEMESLYGKYVFNHMENIINVEETDLMEVGTYDKYPTIKKVAHKYFDLEKFVKENIK